MSDLRWANERRRLGDLVPWPRNPRQIKEAEAERLSESFDTFGQVETLAVGPGNEIYNGHQRLNVLAAQHGPDYEVDVRVASRPLTEKEREKLTVYLHKGAAGEWNFDMLANEFDVGELLEWGFEDWELGIDEDALLADDADAEPQVSRAEQLRDEWGVEPGQLWALGEHRLYCGDSTDRDNMPYGEEFADLCVTDPPYGTMATGRGGKSIAGDQTYNAVLGLFDTLPLVLKDGAPFYIMGGTFNMPMVYKLFDMTFRQVPTVIVWDKCQFVLRHHDYHNQWEAIFYSWKPGGGAADDRWHGDRKQADVWRIERDNQADRVHITQKPVELYSRAITNSSPRDGIVYEPFSGSGAAIIACQNLGRRARAIEISPAYVAVTLQRFLDAFGIEPELITD